MRARIDMTEVETRTKIRAKYLRAIENEEWDLLPGPVYVKSFLRTYGDFLGLDSRLLVDEYKRRYERPSTTTCARSRRSAASASAPREGRCCRPWAIIGGVLVAVVVALYFLGTAGNKNKPPPPTSVPAAATNHRKRRAHHPARAPAEAKPTTVKLQLVPTGTVYVCLVDGTGKKLIPGQIYSPGQTIPTETASKLLLTLGNASVQMKVNGASVKVDTVVLVDRLHAAADRHTHAARLASNHGAHDADDAGHPDHRDRGADRDHLRPQRAVAVRAAARDRRRRGDDRDRRRPARGPARGARVHGARGHGR